VTFESLRAIEDSRLHSGGSIRTSVSKAAGFKVNNLFSNL